MADTRILLTGASGQIGRVLYHALTDRYGAGNVLATDIVQNDDFVLYEDLDICDRDKLGDTIRRHGINRIYHLAAILSAKGEKKPQKAWNINMDGLLNVLDASVEHGIERVFWPSSIAVFGSHVPLDNTPQYVALVPGTVYGISKVAGENWCRYYHHKYGLDVRSIRYPGVIGYQSPPGGGTTDYAVEIFHEAVTRKKYVCFLAEDSYLPMIYMQDAIKATMDLMAVPEGKIKIHTSYNLQGMSFSPAGLAAEIRKHIPDFEISYEPDFRQEIAASWPSSIDDSDARKDWGWKPDFDLESMTADMLAHLSEPEGQRET